MLVYNHDVRRQYTAPRSRIVRRGNHAQE